MERISNVGLWIAMICLFVMVVLINVEVVGRYFLSFSTLISDEYGAYLYAACSFLGFAYAFRKGNFLRVVIATSRFSQRVDRYFYLAACILGFLFSIVITYEVAKLPYESFVYHSKSLQASETPLFIPQLLLPIGMALMALVFLNEAMLTILKKGTFRSSDSGKELG
jgi:TRAP-type C4-dicarboxylate transport system permease small subunit